MRCIERARLHDALRRRERDWEHVCRKIEVGDYDWEQARMGQRLGDIVDARRGVQLSDLLSNLIGRWYPTCCGYWLHPDNTRHWSSKCPPTHHCSSRSRLWMGFGLTLSVSPPIPCRPPPPPDWHWQITQPTQTHSADDNGRSVHATSAVAVILLAQLKICANRCSNVLTCLVCASERGYERRRAVVTGARASHVSGTETRTNVHNKEHARVAQVREQIWTICALEDGPILAMTRIRV